MKYFLSSLFLISCTLTYAQMNYPLHPSVGDTIDKLEKLDYSLFPQIDNKNFQYTFISFTSDQYFLQVCDTNNQVKAHAIGKTELIEAQQNIEKINQYYRLMEKEKEQQKSESTSAVRKRNYPIRIEGPMTEQMKKEARMNIRLKEDARRRSEFEKGINPNSMHIEFK